MRVIETSLEEDLSLFSRYLWQQRVRHRIFEERGCQIVEVADSDSVAPVQAAYKAWQAGNLVLQVPPRSLEGGDNRLSRAIQLLRRFPVLIGLLILAVVVYPFSAPIADGQLTTVASWLTIVDLKGNSASDVADLFSSMELWRLITPIFLHFSVVHLLFNVAVTTDFGRRIELGRGSLWFASVVVVIAVMSNVGQFMLGGNPLFGGLSGVAYGLLGFVLVSQRRFPEDVAWQMHPGFAFSLVLFLVIFSTGVTEPFGLYVANGAHWVGLISGGVLALLVPPAGGKGERPGRPDG